MTALRAPAIDWSALRELAALDAPGPSGLLREILTAFVDDSGRRLSALDAAVRRRDWPVACREAHTIKGTAALVGAVALRDASLAVEAATRDFAVPDPDAIARLIPAIAAELRRAVECLADAPRSGCLPAHVPGPHA